MKPIIAIFDFDGTIIKNDSLVDFLVFVFGYWKFFKGMAINFFPLGPTFIFGDKYRDVAKEKLFSYFFKNFPEDEFNDSCRRYSLERIDKNLKPEAEKKIQWHKQQRHKLIIISASIKNWIQPWAEKNMFDEVIATEIEIQDNILTGKFKTKNCRGEEKKRRFLDKYPERETYFLYVYSDSKNDKPLLSLADKQFFKKF